MSESAQELYERAHELSQSADELFAERDALKQQVAELRTEYQPRIDELKEEADELASAFKDLYRESHYAYESEDRALAKELSVEGHEKQDACKALNEEVAELVGELREESDTLYQEVGEKHQKAMAYIREAERLRAQSRMMKKEGWRTGDPHKSDSMGGMLHTDTEKYDERGRKIKEAGKLKLSGKKREPSMRDVYPPEKS